MSKKVIVAEDGSVFVNLEQASERFGMSASNVSRAIRDFRPIEGLRMKWVDRVYAVRLKDDTWVIATESSSGALVRMDAVEGARVRNSQVVERRDLTSVWYFSSSRAYAESGTGIEGENRQKK